MPAIKQGDKRGHSSQDVACVIDPNQIDFGLLQRWINKCQVRTLQSFMPPFGVSWKHKLPDQGVSNPEFLDIVSHRCQFLTPDT